MGAGKPDPSPRLSRRAVWALRILLLFLVPVLLCALVEAGLRCAGVGHPTAFFVRHANGSVLIPNDQFGRPFGCPENADPFVLPAEKPAGHVHIFVLGESAAWGTPDPAFCFGRILEAMLREQFPQAQVSVFNAAEMGINSHVVLPIACACAECQADLLVVYMGNNELIGSYGVGTLAAHLPAGLSRPVVRASILARSSRLGQLLERGPAAGSRKTQDEAFFLAHRVGPRDGARVPVYENFRANLSDICALASAGRTQVLVSTVAVNLQDCPPYGSLHRPDLPAPDLARWEQAYQSGAAAESAGRWAEALQSYLAAERLDDQFAELHYRLGTCYAALGDAAHGREQFQLACDCDALPFRSDRRINGIIRDVAAARALPGVTFVDAEAALAGAGAQLFYEHVHFTFHGNYELARTLFPAVAAALGAKLGPARPAPATLLGEAECARRLAFTEWDELKLLRPFVQLFASPPCTSQLGHAARLKRAAEVLQQRQRAFRDLSRRQQARQIYLAALQRAPQDWHLHHNFAELLMELGEIAAAADQWQIVAEQFPHRTQFGEWRDECRSHAASRAAAVDPRALEHYDRGNRLIVLQQNGNAIAEYRQAIELAPRVSSFHNNLGSALLRTGATDDAILHLKQAVELAPGDAGVHANLGVALMTAKNSREAIQHLRRAVELRAPGLHVQRLLAWLLATANDPALRDGAEAVRLAEELCRQTGRKLPASLDALAAAYAETGRFAEAVRTAEEAHQLAVAKGDGHLGDAITARLELYRSGRPYREP